jgi:hypothetical protein
MHSGALQRLLVQRVHLLHPYHPRQLLQLGVSQQQ